MEGAKDEILPNSGKRVFQIDEKGIEAKVIRICSVNRFAEFS